MCGLIIFNSTATVIEGMKALECRNTRRRDKAPDGAHWWFSQMYRRIGTVPVFPIRDPDFATESRIKEAVAMAYQRRDHLIPEDDR